MIGKVVPAQTGISRDAARVFVEGESWSVRSEEPITEGQPVEIVGVEGLVLKVRPKK
jgi:membrane protein implicated in regulation of membrane protease activity